MSVLSKLEMERRAGAFAARFASDRSEASESQTWWNEFFDIFGLDRRQVALFQRAATRASTGNVGAIDVFMPGVFIGEHKSLGKSLKRAEYQAEDYLLGGDVPPSELPNYIVSTDFSTIQISDLANPLALPVVFKVEELPRKLHHFAFLSGYSPLQYADADQVEITVRAARLLGELQSQLVETRDKQVSEEQDNLESAILLSRLIFLMFGDDTVGLWDRRAFLRVIVELSSEDGVNLGPLLAMVFQTLDTPQEHRSEKLDDRLKTLPYVNGGLFRDKIDIPIFDGPMRQSLLKVMNHDWSKVSPSIFGSLFQGLSTKEQRRKHGEHYTSEAFILRLLRPMFLDELYDELRKAWSSELQLQNLWDRIANMRFLDPACGSGNFLLVAYREIRRLELKLVVRLRELRKKLDYFLDGSSELKVSQSQFAGIELKWWPIKIAEAAMFLVDHQCNLEMQEALGAAPVRLPIQDSAKFLHGDSLRMDWESIFENSAEIFIFGNPPFHGTKEREVDETESLRVAWGDSYSGNLDFVTGWHAKALSSLSSKPKARFAFVTTNSIVQGQSVALLFPHIFNQGWRISFAHNTFGWTSEATGSASVHVVIVGFDKEKGPARLFEYDGKFNLIRESMVSRLNGHLLEAADLFVSARSSGPVSSDMAEVQSGSSPIDFKQLVLSQADYEEALRDPVASGYLRKFQNGKDFIQNRHRWCLWLVDLSARDLAKSKFLKTRLEIVRSERLLSDRIQTKEAANTPHLFGENRQPQNKFLAFPQTFTLNRLYLTVGYLEPEIIIGQKIYYCEDPDGLQFAIASSKSFYLWQLLVGGRMKSDPSFSNTLVWNNYPLPALRLDQKADLVEAAQWIIQARAAHSEATLEDLYMPDLMPKNLREAHLHLDKLTLQIFDLKAGATDREVQLDLLERFNSTLPKN